MSAFITNKCMTRREEKANVKLCTHTTSYSIYKGMYYPQEKQSAQEFEEYKKVVVGYRCYYADRRKRLIPVHIVSVCHPVGLDYTVVFIVEEDNAKRPKQYSATICELYTDGRSWLLQLTSDTTEDLKKKADYCITDRNGPRLDVSAIERASRRELNQLLKSIKLYRDLPMREQDL